MSRCSIWHARILLTSVLRVQWRINFWHTVLLTLLCRKLSPFPLDRTVVCWQLVGHLTTTSLQLFINSLSLPRWVRCVHLQSQKWERLTCYQCYVLLPTPCCCRTMVTHKYPQTSLSLSTSMTLMIFLQNLPCRVTTRRFERMTPLWETQPSQHQLTHAQHITVVWKDTYQFDCSPVMLMISKLTLPFSMCRCWMRAHTYSTWLQTLAACHKLYISTYIRTFDSLVFS